MVVYLFFSSDWLFTKKGPFWVFFCLHSDSLNMNDIKLTFNVLIKLNTGRPSFGSKPLLSKVREIYENGIVFRWATTSVCYPLWTHKNEKRHSSIMMGELREGNHFANQMVVVCHLWTWHLSAYHSVNWVLRWFTSRSSFMSHVTPLSLSK